MSCSSANGIITPQMFITNPGKSDVASARLEDRAYDICRMINADAHSQLSTQQMKDNVELVKNTLAEFDLKYANVELVGQEKLPLDDITNKSFYYTAPGELTFSEKATVNQLLINEQISADPKKDNDTMVWDKAIKQDLDIRKQHVEGFAEKLEQYKASDIAQKSSPAAPGRNHAAPMFPLFSKDTPDLINEWPVHPAMRNGREADNTATQGFNGQGAQSSFGLAGSMTGIGTGNDVATQTEGKSNKHSYAAIIASSLATILGAILVIIPKTHSHDEMDIDGGPDITPQEPNYQAIGDAADQRAEAAFEDKWLNQDKWGPGMVDQDGNNADGVHNPYYVPDYNNDLGQWYMTDELTDEGQRALAEVKEHARNEAVNQARADYDKALAEAAEHNNTHGSSTVKSASTLDHNAMTGIGGTLMALGSLATFMASGNLLTKRSHEKQLAAGEIINHGPMKTFVERHAFRIKA